MLAIQQLEAMRLLCLLLLSALCCHGNMDCLWSWGQWSPCIAPINDLRTVNNGNSTIPSENQGFRDRLRIIKQLPNYGKSTCSDDIIDSEQCTGTKSDTPVYCSQPQVKLCKNGYCVSGDLWCNSEDDCLDNSDELNCTAAKQ